MIVCYVISVLIILNHIRQIADFLCFVSDQKCKFCNVLQYFPFNGKYSISWSNYYFIGLWSYAIIDEFSENILSQKFMCNNNKACSLFLKIVKNCYCITADRYIYHAEGKCFYWYHLYMPQIWLRRTLCFTRCMKLHSWKMCHDKIAYQNDTVLCKESLVI